MQASQTSTAVSFSGAYVPSGDAWDEAFDANGGIRPDYRDLIDRLAADGLAGLAERCADRLRDEDIAFRTIDGVRPFVIDPVPRIIAAPEWRLLELGLAQRARALNEYVRDVYGDQRIVEAGVVPASLIEQADLFEPDLVGTPAGAADVMTHICGMDLVRCSDGIMRVLEDNVRSPSGLAFSVAARRVGDALLADEISFDKLAIDTAYDALADALRCAAPSSGRDPSIVILSDGPTSGAWYEHRAIARAIRIEIVRTEQLERRGDSVVARIDRRAMPVDVIYRRTDVDRIRDGSGRPTALGELLLDPLRAGTLVSVNAFGTGVADDKLAHAYVERMIDFYLGEAPLLESIATLDPAHPGVRSEVVERIGEFVIKPRAGLGGAGVMIGPEAESRQLAEMRAMINAEPEKWVAQEFVALSTHPTVVDDHYEQRHIDLRPYVIAGRNGFETHPGCLTRVALERGGLVVNSSSSGGGKDTWIGE